MAIKWIGLIMVSIACGLFARMVEGSLGGDLAHNMLIVGGLAALGGLMLDGKKSN